MKNNVDQEMSTAVQGNKQDSAIQEGFKARRHYGTICHYFYRTATRIYDRQVVITGFNNVS